MILSNICTPTLVLNKEKTVSNIKRIISKCNKQSLSLRPHFKTHQSHGVGRWFKAFGISKITVSSVDMAAYFAADGWDDILIAFPFNPREYSKIEKLTTRAKITLTIPCIESAKILSEIATTRVDVMIKIDAGYGRSGIYYEETESIINIIKALESNENIKVSGLLTHSGNTYSAGGIDKIITIYNETVERLNKCREITGKKDLLISVGDTPSASVLSEFGEVDELRPGNFVFYDLMQFFIGSCRLEEISIVAACPVVDIQNNRKKVTIYGGGVHLSKEFIIHNNMPVYGMAVKMTGDGWEFFDREIYISGLSQEHGIISSDISLPEEFNIGNIIGILPVHSCLTANLLGSYTLIDGSVIDHM